MWKAICEHERDGLSVPATEFVQGSSSDHPYMCVLPSSTMVTCVLCGHCSGTRLVQHCCCLARCNFTAPQT